MGRQSRALGRGAALALLVYAAMMAMQRSAQPSTGASGQQSPQLCDTVAPIVAFTAGPGLLLIQFEFFWRTRNPAALDSLGVRTAPAMCSIATSSLQITPVTTCSTGMQLGGRRLPSSAGSTQITTTDCSASRTYDGT